MDNLDELVYLYDNFRMKEFMERSVNVDHPYILFFCAVNFRNGRGLQGGDTVCLQWNDERTMREMISLAEKGDKVALANLGYAYYEGFGVEKDYSMAFEYYLKSASQGYGRAMNGLGLAYVNGLGVAPDKKKGMRWLAKGARLGCPVAMFNYARVLGGDEMLPWLERSAMAGVGPACIMLAECHADGRGVPRDVLKAAHWYRLAWENGMDVFPSMKSCGLLEQSEWRTVLEHSELYRLPEATLADMAATDMKALTLLAYLTMEGKRGVKKDVEHGAEMMKRASESGEVAAQTLYGEYCYKIDNGFSRNAMKWFTAAAEKDGAQALGWMANYCYDHVLNFCCEGKPDNPWHQAFVKLSKRAIAAGNVHAANNLALHYLLMAKNSTHEQREMAMEQVWRLVCRGCASGIYLLAECCLRGVGMRQDLSRGKSLMAVAAAGGSKGARDYVANDGMLSVDVWSFAYAPPADYIDESIVDMLRDYAL